MGYLIYRIANDITLWLCQNSTWKWPFIVDLPSYKMVIFHSFLYVYQRVYDQYQYYPNYRWVICTWF